jgi:hypothetical protein
MAVIRKRKRPTNRAAVHTWAIEFFLALLSLVVIAVVIFR